MVKLLKCDLCSKNLHETKCLIIHQPQDHGWKNKIRCFNHGSKLPWHTVERDVIQLSCKNKHLYIPRQLTNMETNTQVPVSVFQNYFDRYCFKYSKILNN